MSKYVQNPPDAAALMTSARSFGNYDLAGAIADLVDNSIRAKARDVSLTCLYQDGDPEVRIRDDGCGMSRDELISAMRPASTNPQQERSPDDLGRFGWGLKSASFSQCSHLLVVSVRNGELSGAAWDLENIEAWKMRVFSHEEAAEFCSDSLIEGGTEVIWRKCDRLSENGSLGEEAFNTLVAHARDRLALIFHRYIAGETGIQKLRISLNGQAIAAYDPFHVKHDATQILPAEVLRLGKSRVELQPFILPHYSKLNSSEVDGVSGDEGLLRNQGFYLYRNKRLILYGTWFRLVRHGELSQLVRVRVDIPNSSDDVWRLTVDKSEAQLPGALRQRMKRLVDGLKARSARVQRSKGGNLNRNGRTVPVWTRSAYRGEIRYRINRDHPLIEAIYSASESERESSVSAALTAIEHDFPVSAFGRDAGVAIDSINQPVGSPHEFAAFLDAAIPALLARNGGDAVSLVSELKRTEPFASVWPTVEDYLREKLGLDV